MSKTTNDLVSHNGKTYRLADLAHYMEDDHREAIHGAVDTDSPQGFWDAFAAAYPDEAEHLAEITPTTEAE
jgi:hypothetical protein